MSRRILLVDDDRLYCEALTDALAMEGIEVHAVHSLEDARAASQEGFQIILLDNHLEDGDGLTLVPLLTEAHPRAKIMLCTAHAHLQNAVDALRLGLFDYHQKPIDLPQLIAAVRHGFREAQLEQTEIANQRRRQASGATEIRGRSQAAAQLRQLVQRASEVDAAVLLTGETGTGKTMIARMIHEAGEGIRPFIHVNCAALPEGLVEAELFGSEKGSFTGSAQTREGLFELADGGTLFLDEVGELPAPIQAKLLLALEEGWVRRVGGSRSRRVQVRVIGATNARVEQAVDEGKLRADLYFRLNVIRVDLPPLRSRWEDLPELLEHLLSHLPGGRGRALADGEMQRLMAYDWPGNVRELRNVLERALVLQPTGALEPSRLLGGMLLPRSSEERGNDNSGTFAIRRAAAAELAPESREVVRGSEQAEAVLPLAELERRHILDILESCQGNRAQTARVLGVSVATLRRKISGYEIANREGMRHAKS